MAVIAKIRGWPSFASLELLTRRGLLWFAEVWDDGDVHPAWIITDSSRRNAQARRLSGGRWSCGKAKTLPGSAASWPIGAPNIGERPTVILTEGGPDFLAALVVAWWERNGASVDDIAPICMTGAGHSIHPAALPFFSGKRVRIAFHDDALGRQAGQRWAEQLCDAGAVNVDGFDFIVFTRHSGKAVKDLSDFATLLESKEPPVARVFAGL